MQIELPISKSIANRWLILQAIHGDELMPVSDSMPDDVRIMSEAIRRLGERREARIDIGNCGTAMRFLTAYCAQLEGTTIILDGVERMHHRPIGQLVDALREIGAQIDYLGEDGFPPLCIKGCVLDKHRIVTIHNPQSTQFVSALLLIGANVQTDNTSPYITLTRSLIQHYTILHNATPSKRIGRLLLFGMSMWHSTAVRLSYQDYTKTRCKAIRLWQTYSLTSVSTLPTPPKV